MIDEERLLDLLATWEEGYEQGKDFPAAELCFECPELAPALADRIQSLKRFAWMKKPSGERHTVSLAAPAQELPPTLAGRYRLDCCIAEGGSGKVWSAFDLDLQRFVAIKVPKRGRFADSFLDEARKVARLKHPGIVVVYDLERYEGAYFIISDLIDGIDLGKHLRSHPLLPREAVRIVADIARHLHYAHEQGFIHRDIKPANILVDKHGKVFVTDFGIAVTGEELQREDDDGCGTLPYMSPEQLDGGASQIDFRTDIYSLGVVLFELLTKRQPFEAETPEGVRQKILRQKPPSPRSLERNVPREIERICQKCMAKHPTDRYQTAEALADDLTRWLNRRRTNWMFAGAGLIVCLILAWFGIGKPLVTSNEREANMRLAMNLPHERLGDETPLFNGRNLDGWEFVSQQYGTGGVNKRAHCDDVIRIVDGVLVCQEEPKYWLFTREAYSDFVLKLNYRFPHTPRWNTGSAILLRMTQPGPHHDAHVRARFGGWTTGRILPALMVLPQSPVGYDVLPGLAEAERPIGEWNEYDVTCVDGAVAVRVNGVLVNKEYLDMPRRGTIGLAPQGCAVELRSVKITPIKE